MRIFLKMLVYMIGWLFLFNLSSSSFAQQTLNYRICFRAEEDALPNMEELDSLKSIASSLVDKDDAAIVIQCNVDYWQKDDAYYVLLRKRSSLLRQIFEREGIAKSQLQFVSNALQESENASVLGHCMDVFINKKNEFSGDSLPQAVNYYSEVRSFLNQLIAIQPKAKFRINPQQDTILYSQSGAVLYVPKNSFAVDPKASLIEVHWSDALSAGMIVPYALLSPELEKKLIEWGGIWQLKAYHQGREVKIQKNAALMVFLPTDDVCTDLSLFHSKTSPKEGFKWDIQEMRSWQTNSPLCLHLAEAQTDSFVYYCNKTLHPKPRPVLAPRKPEKPILIKSDTIILKMVDSLLAINELVIEDVKTAYLRQSKKRWVRKKRRLKNEQQYQRELEGALRQKRIILQKKEAELKRVQLWNDSLLTNYKRKFNQYNHIRDSLQQAYLAAVQDWRLAGDSLQWLCQYERAAIGDLRETFGDALMHRFQKALQKAVDPDLRSPKAKVLFPTGKQHFIFPIQKTGWGALQRNSPYPAPALTYKAFTFGPELPSYKIAALAILQDRRATALSTSLDLDNISFFPLPAEAPIHLIALYVDGEKAFFNMHQSIANKLPYKLDFMVFENFISILKALQTLN